MILRDIIFLKFPVNDYLYIYSTAVNILLCDSQYSCMRVSSECILEVELLGHRKCAGSMLLNNTILFSRVTVPTFCISEGYFISTELLFFKNST